MYKPKILCVDIETSPLKTIVWSTGTQFVSHNQIIPGGHAQIITASISWRGSGVVKHRDWGLKKQCDKSLVKWLAAELVKADIIIGQNHKRFDIKWINARLAYHGLPPINVATLSLEDTLLLSRKSFHLPSHSLAYLLRYFGLPEQKQSGGGWERVIDIVFHKKRQALDDHHFYCDHDVLGTFALFDKIAPYVDLTKSFGLIKNGTRDSCPSCGSKEFKITNNYYYTKVSKYYKYQCTGCMHIWKDTRKVK